MRVSLCCVCAFFVHREEEPQIHYYIGYPKHMDAWISSLNQQSIFIRDMLCLCLICTNALCIGNDEAPQIIVSLMTTQYLKPHNNNKYFHFARQNIANI